MNRKDQIQRMLLANPKDAFLNFALAKELEKEGADAGAVKVYQQVRVDTPDYVGTYYHLGKALERLGQPAEAWKIYSEGMDVAKRLGEAHARTELGGARMELGDEEDFADV